MAQDFNDESLAGLQLVQGQLQSDNYNPGLTGWALFKNGNSEFNNVVVRGVIASGQFVGTGSGEEIMIYSGPPALNNLIYSLSTTIGTDAFGNVIASSGSCWYSYGGLPFGPQYVINIAGNVFRWFRWNGASYDQAPSINWDLNSGLELNAIAIGGAAPGGFLRFNGPIVNTLAAVDPVAGTPTAETWHNIVLDAGWLATGSAAPQYRLTIEGNLLCTGRVSQTAWAGGKALNSLNPLAAVYRPKYQTDFYSSDAVGNRAHVSLGTNGVFTATLPAGATGTWNAEINGLIPLNPN